MTATATPTPEQAYRARRLIWDAATYCVARRSVRARDLADHLCIPAAEAIGVLDHLVRMGVVDDPDATATRRVLISTVPATIRRPRRPRSTTTP